MATEFFYRLWQRLTGGRSSAPPDIRRSQDPPRKDEQVHLHRARSAPRPAPRPLREGMTTEGSLVLDRSPIRALPPRLTVTGALAIRACPRLRSLGAGLTVRGDLVVQGAGRLDAARQRVPLAELPDDLVVGGSLTLRNCVRLERIPAGVVFGKSLVIRSCPALRELPDPLRVNGDLTIVGGPRLTSLPEDLVVTGNLHIAGTRIDRLPARIQVGGDLVIEGRCRLRALPEGLAVGRDLILRGDAIEALPARVHVGRNLRLTDARRLTSLPDGLVVPGNLDLRGARRLASLPAGLRVGGSLSLRGCTSLRALPDGLVVPGTLDLTGCRSLASLPAGLRAGEKLDARLPRPALILTGCEGITALPLDLDVGGRAIEVAGAGLREPLCDPEQRPFFRLSWRGTRVPWQAVFQPDLLSPDMIFGEANAEVRRAMLDRVDPERLLARAGARTIDADSDAGGRRALVELTVRSVASRYLHCRCPSTGRQYLLRVPGETPTCRHAAAWLAGFNDPADYQPVEET